MPAARSPTKTGGHHPELLQIIRDEIRDSGPLPFSRFQELCLYHPRWGYYTRGRGIGREGADFWTAPEMNPVFGELVAVQLAEMSALLGSPGDFQVVELGAGTGRLALAALDAWRREASPLYREGVYGIVEPSSGLRQIQRELLGAHGDRVRWLKVSGRAPEAPAGVLLMNEVLDALPVDRVVGGAEGLQEIRVGWRDGGLVELSVPAGEELVEELRLRLGGGGRGLEAGQEAELRPRLAEFLAGAASRIGSGYILAIDYGDRAADLYRRPRGTAMAYHRHRANEDLLARAGHQDITAHVDFTAASAAAADVGFREAGMTSQMKFLLAVGLAERIEALESEDLAEKERVSRRLGMTALIKPGGMGEMFKVWIGARGAPVHLRGLRDPFTAC